MSEWPLHAETPIYLAQAGEGETATHATTAEAAPARGESEHPAPMQFFVFSMIAFIVLMVLAISGTRRLRLVPGKLQNFLELAVESLYGLAEMVMGPRGRKYAPLVSTLFLYILVMNLMSLIPFFKPGTANLSITFGLAIFAFLAVQYYGFREQGLGYLKHFLGPVPWMAFLILPLELISELVRPISLSFRLYGNIFGEEEIVSYLAHAFNPFVAVLMLPLQVMTTILQALVFTLLVTVYISLATQHDETHGETEEAPAS